MRKEINETDVRKFYQLLNHEGLGLTEIRIIDPRTGIKGIGFFDNEDAFIQICERWSGEANIYSGRNPRPYRFKDQYPQSYNTLNSRQGEGGKSQDVEWVTGLSLDLDPIRDKDSPASEEEHRYVINIAIQLAYDYKDSIVLDSGNGSYLWWKITPYKIESDYGEIEAKIKAWEETIRKRIGKIAPEIKLDSVHEIARIKRIIGTWNVKGEETPERQHRLSRFISEGDIVQSDILSEILAMKVQSENNKVKVVLGEITNTLPQRFVELLDKDRILKATWEGKRDKELNDNTRSGYDMSLADQVVKYGFSDSDIASIMRQSPSGKGVEATTPYLELTISKARESIKPKAIASQVQNTQNPSISITAPKPSPEDTNQVTTSQETPSPEVNDAETEETTIESEIDSPIIEDQNAYYQIVYKEKKGELIKVLVKLANFILVPKLLVSVANEGQNLIAEVRTEDGKSAEKVFKQIDFSSKPRFLSALPDLNCNTFFSGDVPIQRILDFIFKKYPVERKRGYTSIGLDLKTNRWVLPQGILSKDGWITDPEEVYIDNGSNFSSSIDYLHLSDSEYEEFIYSLIPNLLALNEPRVIIPLVGWFMATPLKPFIHKQLGHFPILQLWGTFGGGKSQSIRKVFWPLMGIEREEAYSITETEFSFIKLFSSSTSIPIFVDEYRPSDMKSWQVNYFHRLVRRSYDGEVETRGRPDLTLVAFQISTPVVFAGEVTIKR